MAHEHGEVLACALGHAYLCLALTFSGRHAEAAAGDVAAERLRAIDHFNGLVALDVHLGYLHLMSGEFDLAIERCELGLRRLGETRERWARGYLQIIIARALFFQGSTPRARPRPAVPWRRSTSSATSWARLTAWRPSPCWRYGSSAVSAPHG